MPEDVIKENFPKMKKDVNLQIEKTYCVPWNFDKNHWTQKLLKKRKKLLNIKIYP